MGEQSNAYRILLRYDRKSRHRRIKKQRRYERLAATSQFRHTSGLQVPLNQFSALCGPVVIAPSRVGVARTLSMSFDTPTPYRALNRPAINHGFMAEGARSAADCLYSSSFYPSDPSGLHMEALLSMSGIEDLTRVSRIQACRPTDAPNGPHLSHLPAQSNKDRTRLCWGTEPGT